MNVALRSRLEGLHRGLMAGHLTGRDASTASKGRDRETFISSFLQRILPPGYRFGHGDLIDAFEGCSGQIDIVIEFPFFPSAAGIGETNSRVYPCEAVGVAIEVKSDIEAQWDEFQQTHKKVNSLQTAAGAVQCRTNLGIFERVCPVFGVGYTGWKKLSSVIDRVGPGKPAGILIIDKGIFCANEVFRRRRISNIDGDPEKSLWMFACCVFECAQAYRSVGIMPAAYAEDGD
ncbi:MAG: hypothetical protein JSS02_21500 [Planctomycetes bacterium]|nr:hypothetical protein [Planctomycetota bacterium]